MLAWSVDFGRLPLQAVGFQPLQREYPQPPPPSKMTTNTIINSVVMSIRILLLLPLGYDARRIEDGFLFNMDHFSIFG
jgi:hypothetical protein